MIKIYLDTNILINIAINPDKNYIEYVFLFINDDFKNYNNFFISDLVFNETHAGLTNKFGVNNANVFLHNLLDIGSNFKICFHNQSNHSKAFSLSNNPNYIDDSKGLSMVDSLLLLQMEDENGVIYSTDKRMSYYHTPSNRQVAKWVNF
jgi:predicted nucleic acid-binding protein